MPRGVRAVLPLGVSLVVGSLVAGALGVGSGAPSVRAGAPAESPQPPALSEVALSPFDGDPARTVDAADANARDLLAGGPGRPPDPAAAAAAWMDLADAPSTALLEVPPVPYGARGLWWPVREVVLLRLAALPPQGLAAVEERWGTRAQALLDEATPAADDGRLERAAELGPCTRAGGEALLLLADRDLERGEASAAVVRLSRWVRLHPSAPAARRAAVGARLLDARAAAHDARGAVGDFKALLDVALVPVRRGDQTVPLSEVAEAAIREAHRLAASPPRAASPRDVVPPTSPEEIWSVPLLDADDDDDPVPDPYAGFPAPPDAVPPLAASVSVAAGAVWLAGPLSVRRVAPETGVVAWRFPARPSPRARALESFPPSQLPARGLAVADGRVFAVLGDPTSPSTRARQADLGGREDDGRESRARLVALDAATGRLLWLTGAPTERHPVLRARDVSVSSPPTVDGDRVWVTLAARRGAVECWAASFDAATGAVRTVTYLGRGEDGLQGPAQGRGIRFFGNDTTTPAGEAPVRAGDEVCVAPGAGFAAGVRASDGRLRWVQALPAFEWAANGGPSFSFRRWGDDASRAHAADNVPLFAHGSWIVAVPGSPAPAALEAGTGRLRWVGAHEDLLAPPARAPARYVLRVSGDSTGVPRLLMGGGEWGLVRYDAETGRVEDLARGLSSPGKPVGRPWVGDGHIVVLQGGRPHVVTVGAEGPAEVAPGDRGPPGPWPADGDLLRAGDVWLVAGSGRLTAIASAGAAAETAAAAAPDPRDRAARALLAFRRAPSLEALDRAASAAGLAGDADSSAAVADAFVEALRARPSLRAQALAGEPQGLRRTLVAIDRLLPSERAPAYLELVDPGRAANPRPDDQRPSPEALVELCVRWIAFGAAGECRPDPGVRHTQRGDLAALARLRDAVRDPRTHVLEPRAAAAWALAERTSLAAGARTAGPGADAPDPWTASAWVHRARVLAAAVDAGRFADVAAAAADLRLSPPPVTRLDAACAQALRAIEADAVARTGEIDAARDRLHDALAAEGDAARGLDGTPGTAIAAALTARAGLVPPRGSGAPDPEPDPSEAPAAARPGAVPAVLEPVGPGAVSSLARALAVRDGALEVTDATTGAVVATVAPRVGDVGVELLDAEEYVREPGALVRSVAAGRPADAAGLREGDWIVAWDSIPIAGREPLERLVATTVPGRDVDVRVVRDGEERTLSLVVGARLFPPDGPVPEPPRAWMRTPGEAVLLEPYGLVVVDLSDGAVRPLWTAPDGPAAAEFCGFADALYVARGARDADDCSLTAIDARTGQPRWTVALDGPARGEPRVLGSAVVVDVRSPERTLVFDAATGARRGSRSRARPGPPPRWARNAQGWRRTVESGDAAGLVVLLTPGPPPVPLAARRRRPDALPLLVTAINPTTGGREWEQPATSEPFSPSFPFFEVGGIVAVAIPMQRIEVYVPDLLGGLVGGGPVPVTTDKIGVTSSALEILPNTRLAVRGDVVHIVRSTEYGVSVGAVEIDRDAIPAWRGLDAVVWHGSQTVFATTVGTSPVGVMPGKAPQAVFARATPEGCWVLSAFPEAEGDATPARATWYEPLHGDAVTHFATRLPTGLWPWPDGLGPVTVGSVALVPSDRGFRRVPLVLARDR